MSSNEARVLELGHNWSVGLWPGARLLVALLFVPRRLLISLRCAGVRDGYDCRSGSEVQRHGTQKLFPFPALLSGLVGLCLGCRFIRKCHSQIADIKNANGLNSDMALFARNTIVIPPKRAAPGDR